MSDGFLVFDTAIGPCAVAWRGQAIFAVQLPEATAEATAARMRRRHSGIERAQPPEAVADVIRRIVALLDGEHDDLTDVAIDFAATPDVDRPLYDVIRAIPPGATMTYGEIAERLGGSTIARGVGQSMGRNPVPIVVPCHRVMAANGGVGGFSAPGGVETKMRILEIERAHARSEPSLFGDLPLAVRPARR